MREIVVISGKGGTGKTSISLALATLAQPVMVVDCDVDAADMHLILDPTVQESHEFFGLPLSKIDPERCVKCGACQRICRFDTIRRLRGSYWIDPLSCERCGVCVHRCPRGAITTEKTVSGHWYRSHTRMGPMVHAHLEPGAENSGMLVTLIRREAKRLAESGGMETIIVDGPPGIGCPVIASLSGASMAVVVTEPTAAGVHDLQRVVEVAARFKVPVAVIINKVDLNPEQVEKVEQFAQSHGMPILGRIPYDWCMTQAQLAGRSVPEYSEGPLTQVLSQIWKRLDSMVAH